MSRQERRHPAPSVTVDAPTLTFKAVWLQPGRARISVGTTGQLSFKDAVGALAEGIKLLMAAQTEKPDAPEALALDAVKPTFRPERVA
jgi:hypothetical protein